MPARRWYPGAALVALACATPSAPTTPPVITRPPAARVVPVNSAHEFSVEATGEGLAYQWRRNGTPIPGATAARHTFRPSAMTDGGALDVVVSNGAGLVTSPAVTVRVVTEQGPWRNDLRLAVGPSPNAFGPFATWVRQAGVSSLARLPDGRLVGAFQWFPFDDLAAFDRVAVVFSSDSGRTWTAPRAIVVTGFPDTLQRPFDPTITVTERGQLRVYFTSGRVVNGQPSGTLGFYSAISSDGVTYAWEPGVRFMTARSAVDCAVVRWNGAWHLVAPLGVPAEGAYHAVSEDGLTFTRRPDLPGMGPSFTFVGNLAVVGSALRFYAGSMQGVWFAELHPDGRWGAPTVLAGVMGGDPAVVEAAPGRWLLVNTQ
jgi:hypothetical protein